MLSSEQLAQAVGLTPQRIRQLGKELIQKGHGERIGKTFAFHESAINYISQRERKDRTMKDTKEKRIFRNFLKKNGFEFNGKWQIQIDGEGFPLTQQEQEINRRGGIDYRKTAADAIFRIAADPMSHPCHNQAVKLLEKHAGCFGYDENAYLPFLSRKDALKCGFSDFVARESVTQGYKYKSF